MTKEFRVLRLYECFRGKGFIRGLRECKKFAVSWGYTFVGNWFGALQYKTIHYFVKRS